MDSPPPPRRGGTYTFASRTSYSAHSSLNTVDIHYPGTPPLSPNYWLIFIHGGAFRDPLVDSTSLFPSLPAVFENRHVAAVAALNYRLSPYPNHPTLPFPPPESAPAPGSAGDAGSFSSGEDKEDTDRDKESNHRADEGRDVAWPVHIQDVRDAIGYLVQEPGMMGTREWIVVGHSVGATMGVMLALEVPAGDQQRWGVQGAREREWGSGLRGVVALSGIYDFVACRDHHPALRGVYEEFGTAAFGEGGWEKGNVLHSGGVLGERVGVVVLGFSEGDELVEVGQAERMERVLRDDSQGGNEEGEERVRLVRCEGTHDGMLKEGREVARGVDVAVEALLKKRDQGISL